MFNVYLYLTSYYTHHDIIPTTLLPRLSLQQQSPRVCLLIRVYRARQLLWLYCSHRYGFTQGNTERRVNSQHHPHLAESWASPLNTSVRFLKDLPSRLLISAAAPAVSVPSTNSSRGRPTASGTYASKQTINRAGKYTDRRANAMR